MDGDSLLLECSVDTPSWSDTDVTDDGVASSHTQQSALDKHRRPHSAPRPVDANHPPGREHGVLTPPPSDGAAAQRPVVATEPPRHHPRREQQHGGANTAEAIGAGGGGSGGSSSSGGAVVAVVAADGSGGGGGGGGGGGMDGSNALTPTPAASAARHHQHHWSSNTPVTRLSFESPTSEREEREDRGEVGRLRRQLELATAEIDAQVRRRDVVVMLVWCGVSCVVCGGIFHSCVFTFH